MENEVLNDIIAYAVTELNMEYGFCGHADSDEEAYINSSDHNGKDIAIVIKVKSDG